MEKIIVIEKEPDDFNYFLKINQINNNWCKIYINESLYIKVNEENLIKQVKLKSVEEFIVYYIEILMILMSAIREFQVNSYPYGVINEKIFEIKNYLRENEAHIYDASLICGNVKFYYENFENKNFKFRLLKLSRDNRLIKMELEEFKDNFFKQQLYFKKELSNLISNLNYFKKVDIEKKSIEIQTLQEVKELGVQIDIEKIDKNIQCNIKDEYEIKYNELLNENRILREKIKELKTENKTIKKLKKELESIENKKNNEIKSVIKQKDKELNLLKEKAIKMNTMNLEKKIVNELRNTALTARDLFHIIHNNDLNFVCKALNVWFFVLNSDKAMIDYKTSLDGEVVPFFQKFWLELIMPELLKHKKNETFNLLINEWNYIQESFIDVNASILSSSIDLIFFVHCLREKTGLYSQLLFIPPFFTVLFRECKNIFKALEIVKVFSQNYVNLTDDEKKDLAQRFLKLFIVKSPFEICQHHFNDPLLSKDQSMKVLFEEVPSNFSEK